MLAASIANKIENVLIKSTTVKKFLFDIIYSEQTKLGQIKSPFFYSPIVNQLHFVRNSNKTLDEILHICSRKSFKRVSFRLFA